MTKATQTSLFDPTVPDRAPAPTLPQEAQSESVRMIPPVITSVAENASERDTCSYASLTDYLAGW